VGSADECTLTDREPEHFDAVDPGMLSSPFADITVADLGDVVRVEAALTRTPATDATFEALLAKFKEMLLMLVRRPRVILMVQLSMQDAAVPAMRHVKQFINFVGDNAFATDLLIRGVVVVLKPQGMSGYALQNIVKMVLRVLPPPWQTAILPTPQDSAAFLDRVTAIEAEVVARRDGRAAAAAAGKGGLEEEATPSMIDGEASPLTKCSSRGAASDFPSPITIAAEETAASPGSQGSGEAEAVAESFHMCCTPVDEVGRERTTAFTEVEVEMHDADRQPRPGMCGAPLSLLWPWSWSCSRGHKAES